MFFDPADPFAPTRRALLRNLGGSVGLLGLSSFLRSTDPPPVTPAAPGKPHHAPKAKRVIFLFMAGGPSHLDLFDPKPALEMYAGKRPGSADLRTERVTGGLLPSPFKFRPGGECGLPVSDLLPETRKLADELCVLRAVHAVNPNHSPAANFLASGRIDATHPGVGAWVAYGLGSENADLPGFVSLGSGFGQAGFERAGYLPGQFQATRVSATADDPEKMIRHLKNPTLRPDDQRRQLDALQAFNRGHAAAAGDDPQLEARVKAMETAFRMQTAAGEAFDLRREPPRVRDRYGPGEFARGCLLARRLVEAGVRLVRVNWTRVAGAPNNGHWDTHAKNADGVKALMPILDAAYAALLDDLADRGLLDDTLVIWTGEFGRTPKHNGAGGRDHWGNVFSLALAGGGVRGGVVHGKSDKAGGYPLDGRVRPEDLTATVYHTLGIPADAEVRDTLDRPHPVSRGRVIKEVF